MLPQSLCLPAYAPKSHADAEGTLADVLASVAARLDVPGFSDSLDLGPGDRWVVLLVDGLGEVLLEEHAEIAPFLTGLAGRRLTCGVPSTTATSLTSLGTGLPPGQHGTVGYSFWLPQTSSVLNALAWNTSADPEVVQPHDTVFQRAAREGVEVGCVSCAEFRGSGMTRAGLRGPRFWPIEEDSADLSTIADILAASSGERSLVYAYQRELDHTGHLYGVRGPDWRAELARIDAFCARLRDELDDGVRLLITGDHGMIDVPGRNFLIVEDEPALLDRVTAMAGEPRFRQLYTDRPEQVRARWEERLGEHAWVRTRQQAIDAGWFGPVAAEVAPRIGDVLVAMRTDWGVMTTQTPGELRLVGMHGSLTEVEMLVPLKIC